MFINGELPKDEKYPLSCVYWIHTPDMTDPKTQGYIGVSAHGLTARYNRHKRDTKAGSQLPVHRAIRKYGENIVVTSVAEANPEFCLMIEESFRPITQMGGRIWNVGAGGVAPTLGARFSDETKKRLSESHKGRKHTEETKAKISAAGKGREVSFENRAGISKRKSKWLNSAAGDVWLHCIDLHSRFVSEDYSLDKLWKEFGIGKATLWNMRQHFRQDWNPNYDEAYLSWLSEQNKIKEKHVT